MESKKINQLATNLSPVSTDLTIIGDPITGVSKKVTLLQIASLFAGAVDFYDNLAAFPVTGSINTLYCAKDTNKLYLWSGSAYVQTFPSQALLDTYQLRSEKGVSNGYASLDSSGKVPIAQLPSSIMEYKGMWSAATNTPTLANGTGDTGDVYICNAAGSVNFGAGAITFAIGDYVVYSGTIWQRSSGAVGTVTSVGLSTNGNSITIGSSPVTTSGTITANFAGSSVQYIDGAGNLQTFPTLLASDSLVKLVRNNSGATMTAGTIIYINGALGNKPTIAKALATGDSTSAQTYGLLQADIANNADGYVVVIGNVTNLDTSALTEGQQLYLSGTTAGTWTTTKPYAPIHLVYVGIVLRAHPTMGIIGVKIQNGYEMDELHNVDAYLPNNNDILSYNTTTSLWEHKQIATTLGYTPQAALNGTGFVKISGTTISYDNSTYLTTAAASTTYLPMILSATAKTVDINGQQFNIYGTASSYTSGRIVVDPLFACVGYQISGIFDGLTISTDGSALFSNSGVTRFMNQVRFDSTLTNGTYTYTLPSATGTLALVGSLGSYVPYTGATGAVNLGTNELTSGNAKITDTLYLKVATTYAHASGYYGIQVGTNLFTINNSTSTQAVFSLALLTTSRTFTLPDASGTIALVGGSGIGTVTSVGLSSATSGVTIGSSPVTTSGTITIAIATATTSQNGLLSSTDWTTFNSKGSGTVTSVAALTVGTSGTDLSSSVATGTTTPVITLNVPTASATNRGALSSADWTTFNSKQSALTNPVTGTGTTNYLPKFTGTSTIGNSAITDDGTTVTLISRALSGTSATFSGANNAIIDLYNTALSDANARNWRIVTNESIWGALEFRVSTANNNAPSSAKLILSKDGNTLIGTTTDAGYKLDVNGTGRFSGDLTINGTNKNVQLGSNTLPTTSSNLRHYFAGAATFVGQDGAGEANVGNNFYYNAGFLRRNADYASNIRFDAGNIYLQVAASGAANSAITWTNAVTIANSGAATFSSSVTLSGNSDSFAVATLFRNANRVFFGGDTGGFYFQNSANTTTIFKVLDSGAATFSSSVLSGQYQVDNAGTAELRLRGGGYGASYNTSLRSQAGAIGVLQFGNNNDNYILAGNTAAGGFLIFRVNCASESITAGTEAMRITSGGNVLIGTTDDGGRLVSYSTTAATQIKAAGTAPAITFSNTVLSPTIGGVLGACTAASQFLTGTAAGDMILINQFTGNKLYITNYSGGVYLTQGATSWTANSDIKLKNINSHIENAVEKLSTLQTINFSYKDDKTNKQNLGLIAQEVEKIFPELIDKNGDGMLGVRYTELVPVLIKAIQELKLEIETLKNK